MGNSRAPGGEPADDFQLRYLLASSLYGYADLAEVVRQVRPAGATAIDIWPRVHGNQREQLDELGEASFSALLRQERVALGCLTQYPLGPFRLPSEMRLAQRLGCHTIVTGSGGPKNLQAQNSRAPCNSSSNACGLTWSSPRRRT